MSRSHKGPGKKIGVPNVQNTEMMGNLEKKIFK